MAAGISIILLIIIVIIVIAVIAGIIAYNRHLDKVAKGELRDTHSSIPEPRTTVGVAYSTVTLILLIIMFFSVMTVNGQLNSLQATLNSIQSDQRWIISRLDELKEKERLVKNLSYGFDNGDLKAGTTDVHISLTLNEYTDDTTVSLTVGDEIIPLVQKNAGGIFEATVKKGLYEPYRESYAEITESGKTIVEDIDFPSELFMEYLPLPEMNFSFSSHSYSNKLKYSGSYSFIPDQSEEIESATVTYMTNGEDLKTLDVTKEVKNGNTITLEKGLDLDKDLALRIEFLTKNGFVIIKQTTVIHESYHENDTPDFLRIIDPDGDVVWEENY